MHIATKTAIEICAHRETNARIASHSSNASWENTVSRPSKTPKSRIVPDQFSEPNGDIESRVEREREAFPFNAPRL